MPNPKPGESQANFIKRCVPIVIADGTAKDGKQGAAVCASMWKSAQKKNTEAFMADKSGARHSTGDLKHGAQAMAHLKQATDHLAQAGFAAPDDTADQPGEQPDGSASKSAARALAIKCWDMGAQNYAMAESWDINQAASALSMLASLAEGEIGELSRPAGEGEDPGDDLQDVSQLAGMMRLLLKFISSEIDEMEAAAQPPAEAAPDAATAAQTATAQAAETVVVTAKSALRQRAAKAKWDFNYINHLHLPHSEQYFRDVLAAKFVARDTIKSYSMLWGDSAQPDIEADYFDASTNFWDDLLTGPKPLTYDHGQNDATKAAPVIGMIQSFGDDDLGRWYEAQLDRAHAYRKWVGKLVGERALGSSSDSVEQYVLREPVAGKSAVHRISQWPWFATALTTTPAEPRMLSVGSPHWKSIGLESRLALIAEQSHSAAGDLARVDDLTRTLDLLKLQTA